MLIVKSSLQCATEIINLIDVKDSVSTIRGKKTNTFRQSEPLRIAVQLHFFGTVITGTANAVIGHPMLRLYAYLCS